LAKINPFGSEFPLGQNMKDVSNRLKFNHEKLQEVLGSQSFSKKIGTPGHLFLSASAARSFVMTKTEMICSESPFD